MPSRSRTGYVVQDIVTTEAIETTALVKPKASSLMAEISALSASRHIFPIYVMVRSNPMLTRHQIASTLGVCTATVEKMLALLRAGGYITSRGRNGRTPPAYGFPREST